MAVFSPTLVPSNPGNDWAFVFPPGYLTLRRRNPSTGVYGPTQPRAASATLALDALPIQGLKEFFSFTEDADYDKDASGNKLGSIDYQISTDNGVTYYYYNGGWVTAGPSNFSPASTIDANILSLPINALRQVVIKVRMQSDSKLQFAPRLKAIYLGSELVHRPYEAALRSIRSFVENNLTVDLVTNQVQATTGTSVTIATNFTLLGVSAVYNITDDPNHSTNLFSSVNLNTKVVTLTSPVASGKTLEILFTGKCSVKMFSEDELVEARLPAVAMTPLSFDRDDAFANVREIVISKGRKKARTRAAPDLYRVRIRFQAAAERNLEAVNTAKAIETIFDTKECTYLPTGEPMHLVSIEPFEATDFESKGLYVKRSTVTLQFREWQDTYREDSLVERINIQISSGNSGSDTYTIS